MNLSDMGGVPTIDSFFNNYLECWKNVGGSIDEADVMVVISDGTGMVKSLQDAIDMECKCHRIYYYSHSNRGGNGDVAGIVEEKDLSIIISLYAPEGMRKYSPMIIVNSGNIHFINSSFSLTEYIVGVEINGGNVLFENVKFGDILIKSGCTAIGVYVKNQATVSMKGCWNDLSGDKEKTIALYAECGNIDIRKSCLKYIVVIGKKGKSSLNMLECWENYGDRGNSVLVGYNTESQIKDCKCTFITLEGKMQMDGQDNLVMNVFDTEVIFCVAAYNGGIIYLYNSGSADCDLEADNGKIYCENFKSEGETVKLRQGMGKNTEIICDCRYKVVNNLRNEIRMGAFSNKIGWLIRNE